MSEEATLSGLLCERKRRRDYVKLESMSAEGHGVTELGTTGTGEPQHQPLKLDGRGTTGSDIRLGQTKICHNGIRPLTTSAMIHGSIVTDGAK